MPSLRPDWQSPSRLITPESAFFNRRRFIKTAIGAGVGASMVTALGGCRRSLSSSERRQFEATLGEPLRVEANPNFAQVDRSITEQKYASRFNNFYEFGQSKTIWSEAQALPVDPWQVEVTGLVNNPQTYDLDDLRQKFPLEERVYRFRCVEAWAMVVPWIGFPMRLLLEAADPQPAAKFVRFESFYDPEITPGPTFSLSNLPWPYHEGLRLEEMANELAFFAVGIYGRTLPKQHGAPIRAVLPWKYGFKGAKSIVKIEFTAEQPATYWNTLSPNEYGFEANVNPEIPHPRWSQETEKLIGSGSQGDWERKPTVIYNGYGDNVAQLYK